MKNQSSTILEAYEDFISLTRISSRICVQLVILTLFQMRCSLTRMSSFFSIVTPILMSSSTVFVDWISQSCTLLSNAASLVGMSSLNSYPSTFIRSPTYLTPSRTASRPRPLRSRWRCDTCPTQLLQLSSECSTSV